ncbi:hypothetical protein BC831DRAFT_464307 [Entophlyctis helioformis]|nr:hypothetical protein BC831DRAFT_464307 [Entophlyctis helioformis]
MAQSSSMQRCPRRFKSTFEVPRRNVDRTITSLMARVPYELHPDAICRLFETFGVVRAVRLMQDETGRSLGLAFVDMDQAGGLAALDAARNGGIPVAKGKVVPEGRIDAFMMMVKRPTDEDGPRRVTPKMERIKARAAIKKLRKKITYDRKKIAMVHGTAKIEELELELMQKQDELRAKVRQFETAKSLKRALKQAAKAGPMDYDDE